MTRTFERPSGLEKKCFFIVYDKWISWFFLCLWQTYLKNDLTNWNNMHWFIYVYDNKLMDWNKVFSTLMWKISQGRKKKNIERKSKTSASKQFSCFLYLYHKIFWRTSFWMQATFVVFSSFMGKKLKQGIRNRNILAFSYLYDKNIWKTSGRHSELKQFPWFL